MNQVEKITAGILNSILGIVLFIISLAAFYLPYELRIIPSVQEVIGPVRIVCAGLLLISFFTLYASSLTVFRGNWALWAGAGFLAVLIFSTAMNNGDMESALGTFGLAGLFLVMDIAVFFKVNPKKYILIAFFVFFIASMANIYTLYAYWGVGMWETYGMYRNVFFTLVGNYNGGIEYILPMAICGCAYAARYGAWLEILNYAAMGASLVYAVKCESDTQIIVYAGILAFMVVGDVGLLFKKFARFLRIICQPIILAGLDLAAFVSIVVINKTNWVERIGLDPDFHNRRHVWNMSIEWIKARPIWGSGQETVVQEATKITGYAHSHSTYLEVAYKTGFVGSVFMVLMGICSIGAIYKNRHDRTSYILSVMLFFMGMAAISEAYPMVYVMLCFGLLYYIAKNTTEHKGADSRIREVDSGEEPDGEYPETPDEIPGEAPDEIPDAAQDKAPDAAQGKVSAGAQDKAPDERPADDASEEPKERNIPESPYETQERELLNVGRKVREAQEEEAPAGQEGQEEQTADPDLDHTVHIDETIVISEQKNK